MALGHFDELPIGHPVRHTLAARSPPPGGASRVSGDLRCRHPTPPTCAIGAQVVPPIELCFGDSERATEFKTPISSVRLSGVTLRLTLDLPLVPGPRCYYRRNAEGPDR